MSPEEPLEIAPTPWDQLDARARRRIEMLISTLSEIEAGFQHSQQVVASAPKVTHPHNHPLVRFMFNSLVNYTCGAFMGSTAGALEVLRSVNLGPWADELDKLLAKPVGDHSLKTFLEENRNTTVAHPTFDPKHVLKRVYDFASLADDDTREQYRAALTEFLKTARLTLELIRKLYPVVAASDDARWRGEDSTP